MSEVLDILSDCRSKGISLVIDDGGENIKMTGNIKSLSGTEKEMLKRYKDDILVLLKKIKHTTYAAITPLPVQESYALSSAQKRLWILSQFENGNAGYNMPMVCIFEGELDIPVLTYAFNSLIVRHEILRTVFREDVQGEVRQIILPAEGRVFTISDTDLREDVDQAATVNASAMVVIATPFDLEQGPLLRAGLFRIADNKWVFVYCMHHIISDGWSVELLIKELLRLYNTSASESNGAPAPLRIQYKDYAAWQQEQLRSEDFGQHKRYWLKQLEGQIPVLDLPADHARPVLQTYHGNTISESLQPVISKRIKALGAAQGTTLFVTLVAAVNALLYRYTGQEDIIIGSPIAGREHVDLEDQMGFYVNTLALRTQFSGKDSFRELVKREKEVVYGAHAHQAYPFDALIDDLDLQRDTSRNALFDVMVVLQNASDKLEQKQMGKLSIQEYKEAENPFSKFDLTFDFTEAGDIILLSVTYNSDIYDRSTVAQLTGHLIQLLGSVIAHPDMAINQLDYLSTAEKRQLLETFNDTETEYDKTRTIIDLFEEQAQQTPDNVAVLFDETSLTYNELNERSNQLAHYLSTQHALRAGDVIGINLSRNEWMVVAILGVLKSGGAYVPLDPDYPKERIDYMVKDSGCKVVIDEEVLKGFKTAADDHSRDNLSRLTTMADLAYVIYTSGSTGQPKGVMIGHGNVASFIDWCKNEFGHEPIDLVLGVTSICFDLSVYELFFTLCTGKTLRVLPNALSIPQYLGSADHILLNTVPSVVGVLLRDKIDLSAVSVLNMAGEPIPANYFHQLNNGKMVVRNLYGPSEDTTYSTVYRLKEEGPVLIGHPIANTRVYILNEQLQLQPIGVAGEICLSGEGLSRGYKNNPVLTAQKFVPHPFHANARLYRTGDQGRWLPDGDIEFLGRKDEQVKVRGYRIELGEIESALQSYPGIEAAVVLAKSNVEGEKELVAYIVGTAALQAMDIRAYLNGRLPTYMLPGYFVQLAALPLTANGKIDQKRLPDPEGMGMETGIPYVAPRNETEAKLVLIWQEILGRDKIGIKDNFFEAGGHSLKATRLSSQIHKVFAVKISLNDLFKQPILEEQARLITHAGKTLFVNIEPAPLQEYYPLSSAQKRLFFLHEFAPLSTSYNMPLVNYLGETADKERITSALKQLIRRHESFRTSFVKTDGVAVQQLHAEVFFELDEHQCAREDLAAYLDAYIRPFDISKAPLLRSSLVKVEGVGYMWVVDIHHIISDGTSQQVLADDFMQLYQGQELSPLRLQYRDFSTWQNNLQESGELEEQEAYWLSQFSKGISKLNFPADRPRPASFSFAGDLYEFTLDASLTALIRDFGRRYQGTLQMTLLSVLNVLLHKYTGQDDLVIGCGIAGRRHPDLERIVGMFVNTIAIRNFPRADQHFAAFYKEVATTCIAAYEHQDVQFEDLVDMLKVERDPASNPIFDVALVVQNFVESTVDRTLLFPALPDGDADLLLQWQGTRTAKFDMSWFVTERDTDIVIRLEYYSAIYDRASMERVVAHFKHVLKTVLAQPDILLSEVNMLTATEEDNLLTWYVRGEKLEIAGEDTFHGLIEKQCVLTPDSIAVSDEDVSLSYGELNRRSDQLAYFLVHSAGLKREGSVGVLQSRNASLLVSIMGILKAGGVYVPLDANYPEERLLYMLEDAGINILLTERDRIEFGNRLQWRGKGIKYLVCVDSHDLYQEHGLWRNDLMRKDLWDHVGDIATDAISGGGWMSSYTGAYLSEQEMQEYSENAYLKLKNYLHSNMKVLEIGCSSGLTMFQVAPYVGAYHGTDLSSVILDNTAKVIAEKGYTHITLSCMPAHEIDQLEDGDFDLVIINSVIQSFDGHNYLRDVLKKAIDKMKSTGWLFIGDIMDEDKRQALIDDLTAFKVLHEGEGLRTKTDLSAELFVSRDYLDDLISDQLGIAGVRYSDKIFTISNELTDYRYDALLRIEKGRPFSDLPKNRYQYDLRQIGDRQREVLPTPVSSTDLAYIIYTSGSTGKPKGVMIEHRNIVAFLEKCRQSFHPDDTLVMPVLASHAFDISLFEVFLPLLAGGMVMMINEEQVKDIQYLTEQLQYVNAFHAVPALMYQVTGYITETDTRGSYTAIKDLFVGGDAVPTGVLEAMRDVFPQARIHVLYGPTESTIFVTAHHYLRERDTAFRGTLIGKPNPGTAVYIMDEYQHLAPVGVIGEICIGGSTLARGYLRQPVLTAEKFVASPFNVEERLYRTGDRGRWMADGNIEFAGRKDDQVKIRGYRIEPGEIEHALRQHAEIDAAAVIASVNAAGEKELVAYIVSKASLNTADIRAHLGKTLPEYMMPAHYVPLTALPLTPNGKVDRRQLPDPAGLGLSSGVTYVAPRNETEAKLVQIWQELLGREGISVRDNFFEMGGHSLKATRLSSQIHKVFDVKVALNELFAKVILEDQARLIELAVKTAFVTIPLVGPRPAYVLSSSQRRLWVLSQLEEGNIAYNMPDTRVFEGNLDRAALEASFAALIIRHESLRTVFREDGEVQQLILPATDTGFGITYRDLRHEEQQEAVLQQLVQENASEPFDLGNGPLLRVGLYQIADHKWVFSYVIHHIISDGWSMEVLIRDLLQLYNSFIDVAPAQLPPLRIQYKDYAAWQQEQLKGANLTEHRAYWLKQFTGPLPVLEMPADKVRPAVKTYNGAMMSLRINESLSKGLRALSREQGGTLFMGLLAVVNTLLYSYTDQEDIVIGTPIAGREHADLENQIGFYLNTLALRTRFSGEDNFSQLLANIREVAMHAYEHQLYPFDELVDALDAPRDMSRHALFDVMVVLQNAEIYRNRVQSLGDLKVSAYEGATLQESKFDLIFNFSEAGEEIQAYIQYNTDIYHKSTIDRLAAHLVQLLTAVIAEPAIPIHRLDYLSEGEKHVLLARAETSSLQPGNGTVVHLFEEQVKQTPDSKALVYRDIVLSYTVLNEIANQLADHLRQQYHIQPDDLVGVKLARSEWLVIAILGVLKSGGAYVPIDPEYPQDRIDYIIHDTGCKVVIDAEVLVQFRQVQEGYSSLNPEKINNAANLAYVIYTSGSSGVPKGVLVTHANLYHYLKYVRDHYITGPITQPFIASYAFDISLFQLFTPLLSGGASVLADKEQLQDIDQLVDILMNVTVIDTVPGIYSMLVNHIQEHNLSGGFSHIERLFIGGDAIPDHLLFQLSEIFIAAVITVAYGPTESTIVCTYLDYAPGVIGSGTKGTIIGKPISGEQIYILNKQQGLIPEGIVGEICIGGAGVARGYLHQPALTAEKFIADPFREEGRIYRSGDLGRWLPDGNIAFIGRADEQVKIRGYRIEPGEISACMRGYEAISDAVVIAITTEDEDKVLAGFFVRQQLEYDDDLSIQRLQDHLRSKLPEYMVPAILIELDSLPLTANGKVDRKALAVMAASMDSGVEYVAPRNAVEGQLALIWQEVLSREGIGMKDDFFMLGGHSLKAARLAGQIRSVFDVKVAFRELFTYTVLEDQAALIARTAKHSSDTIPVAAEQPSYVLSSSQRRLWILGQLAAGNAAYNIPGVYVFEGMLDRSALEAAFNTLLERHEILRTVFKEDEAGDVRQFVQAAPDAGFSITYRDLRDEADGEEQARVFVQASFATPFDMANGPLLRAGLYQLADHVWVFSYVMHHIISDGWSMGVLINELLRSYDAFVRGDSLTVPALRIQYKDYSVWQQEQLSGGRLLEHKAYWLQQFEGALPVLDLPADKPRPAMKTYHGSTLQQFIPEKICSGMKVLFQEQGCTLFMGLLAAVNALFHRYTRQEDIIVGSAIAAREHVELEEQIGFYANTLALRTRFSGSDSFLDLLSNIREVTLNAYEHQTYPFDELVDALDVPRDMSRHPLFDVTVVLQNTGVSNEPMPGNLQVSGYKGAENKLSKFDLSFDFVEVGNVIQGNLIYNTDIFTERTIVRIFSHLKQLLAAVIDRPAIAVDNIDYLSSEEKEELLVGFNDTSVAYPADKTIADLFAAQVLQTPDIIALVFEGTELTYKELDEKSNQLAHYLIGHYQMHPDDLAGIMLDRSAMLIIAILGVLKSGGAYVPIDREYPQERIEYIIADCQCKVVINEAVLSAFQAVADGYPKERPVTKTGPDSLAYVMYTSGSMGVPKGVMVMQRSVVRLVRSTNFVSLTGREVLLSTGAVSFDATTFEYWGMLLNGGRLVLCRKEMLLDSQLLAEVIQENSVNMMWFTAGWLNELVDKDIGLFSGLRTILAGGDRLSPVHINTLLHHYPGITIVNGYGPTENTTFSLTYAIRKALEDIPVGKPISNSTAYILDRRQQLVPVGVAGEVCVGGAGLARGYLNLPGMTAAQFIVHPFKAGERLYKTGDLGRWLPDGNILFMGRQDAQVKVRGYRIESGEIESVLHSYEGITSAVVIARPNAEGEKDLVAYVVAKETLNTPDIRAWLSKRLPEYMIPGYFVQLAALPLTANGKVDRSNLPDPAELAMETGVAYVAPRNETEEKLVQIWQEILGRDKVGMKDNFFEIGGHSLKATRLSGRIHKAFDVKVSLNDLFSLVVLEDQAALIARSVKHSFATIPVAAEQSSYVLSSSQRRLWVLSQFEEGNVAYNMPGVHVFEGMLDRSALEDTFTILLERHEMLRTIFKEDEKGAVRQFVQSSEEAGFHIVYQDLRGEAAPERRLEELVRLNYLEPFNLGTGPLIRASLLQVADDKWVFSYVMHHIISDGWSMNVLINELLQLYNGLIEGAAVSLPPLRIQYKDYSIWQQEQISGIGLQEHKGYWLQQFDEAVPVLELPADKLRPAIKTYNGGATHKIINVAISKGIKALCHEQGCTLFMGLLAAVNALLHRYTNQEDLVIGSPIAGREHADLEGQIGFYLNTLALRTRFSGSDSFLDLLSNIREVTLGAYTHQVYPFDELVDALDVPRDMSRHPLFDVVVVLQNTALNKPGADQHLGALKVTAYEKAAAWQSKFDLTFDFTETGDDIQFNLVYNSDIYTLSTAERLVRHLEQLLAAVIDRPATAVDNIDYLSSEEKQELLVGFNDTSVAYPADKTIADLFAEQVLQTPDTIALVFEGTALTYKELDEKSNQLAHYLIGHYQMHPDDLAGIMLDRSAMLIIAILGVLKSGGAYVPIDREYPQERIEYMIADCQCKVVINEGVLSAFQAVADGYPKERPATKTGPDSLAYVMYTSGSMGVPKGVMVTQRSVVRLVRSTNFVSLTGREVLLSTGAVSFDATTFEYWGMLLNGGRLVLCRKEVLLDSQLLAEVIQENSVDMMWFTAGWLNELVDKDIGLFSGLRTILAGGDRLSPVHINTLLHHYPGISIVNGYGPTENTTFSLTYAIRKALEDIPVGKPISNSTAYILDRRQQLVPVGVAGEVCVGGAGLARGYLNLPGMTAAQFIVHPFKAGERLYKTGDLGRWLPDGNILFIGRQDAQVKVRGYRIESGEIESVLHSYEGITSAVVVARPNAGGEKDLVAYVVGKETLNTPDIRAWLSKRLPEYMIPGYFVQLSALPLTANGKVDRSNLPDPAELAMETGVAYVAPRNETEEKLVQIWQEILGRDKIGIKDNFFEIGGHSLKATRVIMQIRKTFNVGIEMKSVFLEPTIEVLADKINNDTWLQAVMVEDEESFDEIKI